MSARVLLATDIYGQTDATDALREILDGRVEVICPYDNNRQEFQSEAQAYEFFCRHSSVHVYADTIQTKLLSNDAPALLIGFSVGASAMWLCTGNDKLRPHINRFVGFYGNQIRHHLDIEPLVPTTLILPNKERHFCIQTFAKAFKSKALITLRSTELLHGFMNPYSSSYDASAYNQFVRYINQHLDN